MKSLKCFRIGHLNITSLVKHVDELRIYMEDKPFDVLSINESRLDDTVNLNTVNIQGYEILLRIVIARGVVLHFTVETILRLSTEQT